MFEVKWSVPNQIGVFQTKSDGNGTSVGETRAGMYKPKGGSGEGGRGESENLPPRTKGKVFDCLLHDLHILY